MIDLTFNPNFLNRFSLYLRNLFNIKPVDTYYPTYSKASVSDFFYWECNKDFDTKFMLTNVASHIIPSFPQNDKVKIIIFDNLGLIIKSINYELSPYETKEIVFSQLKIKGFGEKTLEKTTETIREAISS